MSTVQEFLAACVKFGEQVKSGRVLFELNLNYLLHKDVCSKAPIFSKGIINYESGTFGNTQRRRKCGRPGSQARSMQ
jgi:hypothetical protein